jgi:hypothetical protein
MVIKSLVASAIVGISIPIFALGVISGMVLAKAERRKPGCGRCCVVCDGRCKVSANSDQENVDRDARSRSD